MTAQPHSTPLSVLDACAARGVALAVGADGALKARGPAGALTAELRAQLTEHKAALLALLGEQAAPAIPAAERTAALPLTSAQARLWFLTQLDPRSSAAYNIVVAVRITGPLNEAALARALDALIVRHEILRTRFTAAAGQAVQQAVASAPLPFARAEFPGDLSEWLRVESLRPFDLAQPPLIRGTLLRSDPRHAVFVLTLHHLISDGWSSGVIIRDVAELYAAEAEGRPAALPHLSIQFGDYAVWQNARMNTAAAEASLAHWSRLLAGVPVLELPTDRPRPAAMSFRGRTHTQLLPPELAAALREFARREGATLFQVLLAGFSALMGRYSRQTDFAIGTSIANRPHPALEPLIGLFTNTLALRVNLGGQPAFRELLSRVRTIADSAYAHAETPLEQIIEKLQPQRTLSQNPLFQVCFSLLQAHRDTLRIHGAEIEQQAVPGATARFDLAVTCEDARTGLIVAYEYSTDLFDAGTIERLARHLGRIWAAALRDPDLPASALPLLDAQERGQLLRTWNATATPYPRDASVPALVAEWARATPAAPAVRCGNATLTYAELDQAATRLARRLVRQGLRLDQAAAVCSERTAEMVVALLGVLKAGGCYLPFDPADPPDRLKYLFQSAGVELMLAPPEAEARLPSGAGARWIPVSLTADDSGEAELPTAGPENLAYITFTSGSTGRPKGICIPHRGVVRLVRNTNYLDYGPQLRILELAPVSFDASTFELWGALCNGAALVVFRAGPPTIRDLAAAIQSERITSLYLTSALFNVMTDEQPEAFAGVKHLLIGGDALSPAHVRRVLELHPGLTVINGYGPTETTTFASCGILRDPEEVGHNVTIGPPISNTTLFILDDRLEPVPIGVPGDLYLGGDGNARCYLGLPELTAECFVPHPEPTVPGERLYRTGDLARWKPDGTAEFLGRKDFQVKIRGFRVEPAEIETILALHSGIQRAVVLVRTDPAGKTLVGCVEPRPGVTLDFEEVRGHLRTRLPEFMLPATFVAVASLPLTAHGKIDRGALQRLAADAAPAKPAYASPADPASRVLAQIWASVLNCPQVGLADNFFDLGGHSLLATRLMWRVSEVFRGDLPLRLLFDHPTLGAFSAAVRQTIDTAAGQTGRAERIARIHQQVSQLSPEEVARRLAEKRRPQT